MRDFFRHTRAVPAAAPLRIGGLTTVMTPQPDEAELAAQALLETLAGGGRRNAGRTGEPEQGTPGYYRRLSERIASGRAAEARLLMRCVAWCEMRLQATGRDAADGMERELYRHQAAAEREGGELLRRWQHCLAEAIVRHLKPDTEKTDTDP